MDPATLKPDMALKDVASWDSMAVLEFQALADVELKLVLQPDQISACETVSELCELVSESLEE